jgi:preprotein translocase subunit Sss1
MIKEKGLFIKIFLIVILLVGILGYLFVSSYIMLELVSPLFS